MSFRCFRLLDAIGRQHVLLWFTMSVKSVQAKYWTMNLWKNGKRLWNGWEGFQTGRVEAPFLALTHYSALLLLHVAPCFMFQARLCAQLPYRLLESSDHWIYHPGRKWRPVLKPCPSTVNAFVCHGHVLSTGDNQRVTCMALLCWWLLVFVLPIQEIGGKFVDPPTFDIAKSYADSALLLQKVLNPMKHGPKQQSIWRMMKHHDEVVEVV